MSSFRPQIFGKYFLVDKIATGGMAEIFKAKTYSHGGFENLLVIKRILPHIGDNEEFVEMFIDEAKVSVALQHANIVRIYDFGKILDNYFIAMECVDGKDVRNLLKKLARARKYLPIEYAAYLAHEALRGLHYAHVKADLNGNPYGIVHRDISPSNVIVSYEGMVKVADFGIAKAESNAYETQTGVLKGKYEYMSPEQAQGQSLDARSDVFSLGIILHEMLTGRRLFKGENELDTLRRIRDVDYKLPSEIRSGIPPKMDRIVQRALTRDRDDRYQHAEEMANDLAEFLSPVTPMDLRQSVQNFMQELFADEIAEERKRLEEGSEVAQQLRTQVPPDAWEGHTDSTMTAAAHRPQALIWPWLLALGFALAVPLMVAVPLAVVVGSLWSQQAGETGSIEVKVTPVARIYVDDAFYAESGELTVDDLSPGSYNVRFEADEHEPMQERVAVTAGQSATLSRTLKKIEKAKAKAAKTKKTTRPSSRPKPSAKPKAAPANPRPRPAPVGAKGTVKVVLVGVGWGHVYINGKKLRKTAPLSTDLSPGTYDIRVENAAAGLKYSTKVTVVANEKVTVKAKP